MNTQSRTKLKWLLDSVPPGHLVTSAWLADQGTAYETFRDYVNRGWLERVARGVLRRPSLGESEAVDWQTCVVSMQRILGLEVHLGSMTALGLHGYQHDLALDGESEVWLYGDRIPSWITRVPLNAKLRTRSRLLFEDSAIGLMESSEGTAPQSERTWALTISSPERAILEALDELPDHESFTKLDRTFESLATLRPRVLELLLGSCRRVKTKRLFFVFADRHDHPWRRHVLPEEFDLGSGDRALVKGGAIHPRYRIMVPREFASAARGENADA